MLNIEMYKFGLEIESNFNAIDLHDFKRLILSGYVNDVVCENEYIFEVRTKPVKLQNVRNVVRRLVFYNLIKNIHVEGSSDMYAGSSHLHLSFSSEFIKNNKYLMSVVAMSFDEKIEHIRAIVFSGARKIYEDVFRDVVYEDELTNVRQDYVGSDSKSNWITVNSVSSDNYTIEFRINESLVPLWMYVIPVFKYNVIDYEVVKLGEQLEDCRISIDEYVESITGYVCNKKILECVLEYWKDKVSSSELFEDIMNVYFEEEFKGVETLKFMKEWCEGNEVYNKKVEEIEEKVEDLDIFNCGVYVSSQLRDVIENTLI